jgi:diguanylate cyclase (GGDEF)-like protein/PAS domain S-box-containing protein
MCKYTWDYAMIASDPTHLSQATWQSKTRHGTHELGPSAAGRLRTDDELRLHSEIVRHIAGGVALTRIGDGMIIYANFKLAYMLGYTLGEISGQHDHITRPLGGSSTSDLAEEIAVELGKSGVWAGDLELLRKDGSTVWCHTTVSRFEHHEHGQLWLAIYEDITERKRAEDELRAAHMLIQKQLEELRDLHARLCEEAIRDPLTQLYNRRYLHDQLSREIALAACRECDLAILMIDIDHFKLVNDTYGHAVGDAALYAVAELLQANLRVSDIACRYGGEEMLCVLMGVTEQVAIRRADELRIMIAELPILQAYPEARVTVSIGVAIAHASEASMAAMMQAADQALYRAKSEGRNCVRLAAIVK